MPLSGEPLVVVGLGASAGGLQALKDFFSKLPADTAAAYLVVTHQHPGVPSLLPEILGKNCRLPVVAATLGAIVKPNHVYVTPPGTNLALDGARLRVTPSVDSVIPGLPIDNFLRQLAREMCERAVCVILSGSGSDGTLGLAAIKGGGGMVMVQDPASAQFPGMPSSAIATGLADFVLRPADMPAQLIAHLAELPHKTRAAARIASAIPAKQLQQILSLLRTRTGHDLTAYKPAMIQRRIERRMSLHQIGEPAGYLRLLQQQPGEIDLLLKELLISVTRFFRDREAWEKLAKKILPSRLRSRAETSPIRAWVPACATGEEAYSVAILLRACLDRLHLPHAVQIFGTDLDGNAIEVARAGRYPEEIAADVPAPWLAKYFTRKDRHYVVNKDIRRMVTFAVHNVASNPPFIRVDWISCRNLLIYLDPELQRQLVQLFHYALNPDGLLFLGASESVGDRGDLFGIVDRKWKIYSRRLAGRRGETAPLPAPVPLPMSRPASAGAPPPPAGREPRMAQLVEQALINTFLPPGVLVNERGDVLYIHGRTGQFLEPAAGGPGHANIYEMARGGLATVLRLVIRQAASGAREIVRENIPARSNGSSFPVRIAAVRLKEPEPLRGLLLVTFQALAGPVRARVTPEKAGPHRTANLLRSLQEARDSLRTTVNELATTNQDLNSSNEELQSVNEEMQSSNEELESSREELQSLNEELTTVNSEQAAKVEELARARDDMQNLLNSTGIATVFLDNDLRIRRYTDTATKLFQLLPTDVGRSLFDQVTHLKYPHFADHCRNVLQTLKPHQAEVESRNGDWNLMRILPYRTIENAIDGLVITFVNITDVTLAEKAGRETRAYFENIFNTVREPLVVLDEQLHVVSANKAFYGLFLWRPRQVEGELIYDIGRGEWNNPELRRLLEEVLPQRSPIEAFRFEADFPKVGHRAFLLNARRLEGHAGLPGMVLLALQDSMTK